MAGKFYNITLDKDKGYTEVSEGNYTVDNEKGLRNLAKLVNSNGGKTPINITLTGDITLTGEWTPIGNYDNRYTGTFDGNGHTITGLTVNQKERGNVGLIGYLGSGGKVQNLTLENVNLNGTLYVGGVVGYSNNGTVTACYWSNYAGYGIGNGTGDATKVDGATVTWANAVNTMNNALNGSEWQYELTGALPALKKQ